MTSPILNSCCRLARFHRTLYAKCLDAIGRISPTTQISILGGADLRFTRLMRPAFSVLVVAIGIWGLTDVRLRGRIDPQHPEVHKTDLTVYTNAGKAIFSGGDPYAVVNPRGWKYLYPPLFAMVMAPLGALAPQTQVVIWFAVSLCFTWGCYHECAHIARTVLPNERRQRLVGPLPNWIAGMSVAAAALPALNCLQRGQVGLTVLYFLLLGFRLLVQSRQAKSAFVAGAALAIPVALKVTPIVPVAYALAQCAGAAWCSRRSNEKAFHPISAFGGWIAGMGGLFLVLPALLIGWQANAQLLNTWWNHIAIYEESALADNFAGDNSSERNQSLVNAAHRFGNWITGHPQPGVDVAPPTNFSAKAVLPMDAPLFTRLLLFVRVAFVCLFVAVAFRIDHARDPLGQTVGFCLACILTLIIFQIARGHYFVVWLPTILFTAQWLIRERGPVVAFWLSAVPVVLVVIHYVFLNEAGRVGLLGIGTSCWFASICVLLLTKDENGQTSCKTFTAKEPAVELAA
jgi:hypothetical protein